MSDTAAIDAGRAAWQRIKAHGRKSWDDWLTVARAVEIGRDAALKTAGAKTPFGRRYTKAMTEFLRANCLDEIGQQVRSRLMQILEHRAEIEAFREALPEDKRAKFQHPDSVWWAFRRSVTGKPARAPVPRPYRPSRAAKAADGSFDANKNSELENDNAASAAPMAAFQRGKASHGDPHRSVFWPQDAIGRAALAMREHFSNDVYAMARIALEAAIRSEADLFELIDSHPKQMNQIRKPKAIAAATEHAAAA